MRYFLEFRKPHPKSFANVEIMTIETTPQVPPLYREGDTVFLPDGGRGWNVTRSQAIIIDEGTITHVVVVSR